MIERSPGLNANNTFAELNTTGLNFDDTTTGSASGNTIQFQTSGSTSNAMRRAIRIAGNASPVVTLNTIEDNLTRNDIGIGIFVSSTSTLSVTGNNISCSGGDEAFQFFSDFFDDGQSSTVSGNTLSCGTPRATLFGGTITTDRTLRAVDSVNEFFIPNSFGSRVLTVAAGSTLTLEAGVTLDIEGTAGTSARLDVDGTLNANGATITGADIRFRAGSAGTIQNSFIESNNITPITVADSSRSFIGNTFSEMAVVITLFSETNVLITGNMFIDNGVAVDVDSLTSLSTISANSFISNTRSMTFASADILFQTFPQGFDTNMFLGTGSQNSITLPSSINVDGTLPSSPTAYLATGNVNVASGVTLVVPPGVVIKTSANRAITVADGARIVAQGTPEFPVVFTAENAKVASRWNGLEIIGDGSGPLEPSLLQNCVIEFSQSDGLTLTDASIEIDGCRISDNSQDGVQLNGTSGPLITNSAILSNLSNGVNVNLASPPLLGVEVAGSSIFSNGAFGINNLTPLAFTVIGENNYWGADTGPFDPSDDRPTGLFNPTGAGQGVSDGVDYDPWIRLGPSVEGTVTALSGFDQIGVVGEILPLPLTVEVLSTLGSPLEGIEVIFSIAEGDATLIEAQPLLTGVDGRASVFIQLGIMPGEIRIAATARDVNSPLAVFMAEADAPCLFVMTALAAGGLDTDGDGIPDEVDNCIEIANPEQINTDGDPYGNMCDADLNGDGTTDFLDLGLMKSRFFTSDPDADLNGDGLVDFLDLGMLKEMFLTAPGP